jgi:hypothetical protein
MYGWHKRARKARDFRTAWAAAQPEFTAHETKSKLTSLSVRIDNLSRPDMGRLISDMDRLIQKL